MASLYTKICSAIIFPLHEKLKRHHSVALFKDLERTQWFSPEQIQDLQQNNLCSFLTRITRDVPWYKEQFSKLNLSPATFTLADLQKIPRLDKPTLRANVDKFKTSKPHRLARFNTGGSSGEPLIFFLGDRVSHDVAAKWRATRWQGVDIGDKELVLWGSPIEVNTQDRIKMWRDKLLRTQLFPAFDLGEKGIKQFIEQYQKLRPAMLFGYPSAFMRVAQYAQKQGINLKQPELNVCFVTAERLYPEQRELISAQFAVPLANGYGSRDAGFIAHECAHGGMHITAEHIIVEILREDGSRCDEGESGEITITHLHTADFPFVRYRTGDRAVLSHKPCPCGRGLPLLERIDGRTTDFVHAQDGTAMHGLALIYVVRDLPGVQQFRIIQHSIDELEVMLVTTEWDEARTQKVIDGMRARLGASVNVRLNFCEHIPTEKNGKYRYIISKITN